jgi:hypothetical protein
LIVAVPLILALAVGEIGGAGHPATVAEVIANKAELDGKTIYVQGFVLSCQQLGCSLRSSPDKTAQAKSLSFGRSDDFDAEIRDFLGKRVIVRAKLNTACLIGRVMCLDRASELESPLLVNASR